MKPLYALPPPCSSSSPPWAFSARTASAYDRLSKIGMLDWKTIFPPSP